MFAQKIAVAYGEAAQPNSSVQPEPKTESPIKNGFAGRLQARRGARDQQEPRAEQGAPGLPVRLAGRGEMKA